MQSEAEAPVAEPRDVEAAGVEIDGVDVAFGAVQALRGRDAARRRRARSSPSSARAAAASRRCSSWSAACASPTRDASSAGAAALMPQRDALLPWLSAVDNAGLALRVAGASRAARARGGARALRRVRARGLRARAARRALGRDAPARRVPAHAAGRAARCSASTSRSARSTRSRALQMQRWLAGALEREPRTVLLVTHDVEEAVAARRPRRAALAAAGPVVELLDVDLPRPRAARRRAPWSSCASARWSVLGRRRDRGARSCSRCSAAGRRSSALGGVDPLLLPAPTQVLEALWEDRGAARARPLDDGATRSCSAWPPRSPPARRSRSRCTSPPPLRRALRPLVIGSQAVPVPVIAPLVILVLGFGLAPKVLLVALVCFFPITINLYDGLRAADPDARKLLRSLQADALAGAAPRRGARRAAGGVHRPEGRRRRRGDRRRVRRVGGRRARASATRC